MHFDVWEAENLIEKVLIALHEQFLLLQKCFIHLILILSLIKNFWLNIFQSLLHYHICCDWERVIKHFALHLF